MADWSPDGKSLLFLKDSTLYAVDFQTRAIVATYPAPRGDFNWGSVTGGDAARPVPAIADNWLQFAALAGQVGSTAVTLDGQSRTLPRPIQLVQVGGSADQLNEPAFAEVRGPALLFAMLGATMTGENSATLQFDIPGRHLTVSSGGAALSDMDNYGVTWDTLSTDSGKNMQDVDVPLQQLATAMGLDFCFDPVTGKFTIGKRPQTATGHELRLAWNSSGYRLDGKPGALATPSLGGSDDQLYVPEQAFRLLLGDGFKVVRKDGPPGATMADTYGLATWQGRSAHWQLSHGTLRPPYAQIPLVTVAIGLGLEVRRDHTSGEWVISTPGYRGPDLPPPAPALGGG